MEMEKKNLAIIILAVVLAASGVGNIILGIQAGAVKAPEKKNTLKVGMREGNMPAVLDPVDSWDSATNDVIIQVCDGLWAYNLYSGDYELEYTLAKEEPTWDATNTSLTVILRENVWFHDGTPFNATAVQFTFDRIMYFINWSGDLPGTTHEADPSSLFFDSRGNPILNKTVINSNYNITFVLNKPNAIFIPLLAYAAWSIVSPISTPAKTYLELGIDILVGTGPFKYVHLIAGEEMKYERWEYYWGPSTFWDEIIIVYYPDSVTAGNAVLGGEVHGMGVPTSMIAEVKANPNLVFVNLNTSFIYRYFGMNNRKLNDSNLRKAIAFAYNYTYFIEVIRLGYAIRAHHFLPPGFPYYNKTFRAPYWDTGIARQAMLDHCASVGKSTTGLTADAVGVDATNDANWLAKTFYTFKILLHEGSVAIENMNIAFNNDMHHIGISVVMDTMDWETYIYVSTWDEDRLEIWYTGWGPDYMDPFNMIEPLLSNMSKANHIQLQDHQIMKWMWEYEEELDPVLKGELLYKIQQRAINELYVELPVSYDMVMYTHHKSLGNVCYNIKRDFWPRDSYLIPGVPTI